MSLFDAVKDIEPRQQIPVPHSIAQEVVKVVDDWKANNKRAPSALETNLIRERIDKALEPFNAWRDPQVHVKAWVSVEKREMLCWFTVAGKRVALIDMGDQPS